MYEKAGKLIAKVNISEKKKKLGCDSKKSGTFNGLCINMEVLKKKE